VVLVARSREPLEAVAQKIRGDGGQAFAICEDLADKRAIHRITGEAAARAGTIDIVVHNAATLGVVPLQQLADTECEQLDLALGVNVVAPFRLTKALVGAMVLRRRGVIVHISSDAAREAYAGWGAYGVSKAALEHLARIWDTELAGSGVRSLIIDPGEMDTQMHAEAVPDADRSTLLDPTIAAGRVLDEIRRTAPELWEGTS
jgi:NAD(P)-dependent dehydrogenase (short-subunit alcohol dehydrogenase family)